MLEISAETSRAPLSGAVRQACCALRGEAAGGRSGRSHRSGRSGRRGFPGGRRGRALLGALLPAPGASAIRPELGAPHGALLRHDLSKQMFKADVHQTQPLHLLNQQNLKFHIVIILFTPRYGERALF